MRTGDTKPWSPPSTLEERLKYALVPPRLYMRYRGRKEWRRGEAEVRLLPVLADPTRASLDIGANKGVYSWFLKDLSAKVYAFEPNPKLYRILRRLSGAKVAALPYALSDRTGKAELRVPRHRKGGFSNQGGSLSAVKVADDYMAVEVETRRLDDLDLRNVGFVKIDVEGFEQAVLDGARETLARERPRLLIEMEERHTGVPIEAAIAAVERLGYRALFLNRGVLNDIARFDPAHHRARPRSRRATAREPRRRPRGPAPYPSSRSGGRP